MTTPTTPPTTTPAMKSRTTTYAAVAVIVIIIIVAAAYFAFFQQWGTTPTVTFHLKGNATKGWNDTTTGPSITVKMSDRVRIILTSEDGLVHDFVINYSGTTPASPPPSGDQASNTFSSSGTPYNYDFTPSKAGTFKYYCEFHSTVMMGTLTITP